MGRRLNGIGPAVHEDADWTTAPKGFKTGIELDPQVRSKAELKSSGAKTVSHCERGADHAAGQACR
jgi:hypothetical protein